MAVWYAPIEAIFLVQKRHLCRHWVRLVFYFWHFSVRSFYCAEGAHSILTRDDHFFNLTFSLCYFNFFPDPHTGPYIAYMQHCIPTISVAHAHLAACLSSMPCRLSTGRLSHYWPAWEPEPPPGIEPVTLTWIMPRSKLVFNFKLNFIV